MSISVNGQSCVPPGFRFHPTEEELLNYYLRKKVASEQIDLDVIRDVDLNKLEPWDIQEKCKIGSGPQNDWYFFSHKDKKYPTGTRTNRATAAGFWKATGRDKAIYNTVKRIGMRKTLVFYKGRAPHGQKSDWIMHEYRLDDPAAVDTATATVTAASDAGQEDGWVVCRVFKKKHHHKESGSGGGGGKHGCGSDGHGAKAGHSSLQYSSSDDALDQILQYMGRSCKQETKPAALDHLTTTAAAAAAAACPDSLYGKFLKLPPLEHVTGGGLLPNPAEYAASDASGIADWDTLDRLAAYELNGLSDASKNMTSFFDEPNTTFPSVHAAGSSGDGDLWSLARSVSSLHADLMNNV